MSVTKDTKRKGAYWGASSNLVDPVRGGRITLARKIKADKTNNFAIADNIKEWLDISGSDAGGVGNITTRTPGRQAYYPIKDN